MPPAPTPHDFDRTTAFTHLRTVRGHLIARIIPAQVGQREVSIVADEIGAAISELAQDAKGRCMVLDMSDVRMMSSMGLGMCVDLKNRADHARMRPVLFGASATILELLRLMRVDRLYTVVPDAPSLERLLA